MADPRPVKAAGRRGPKPAAPIAPFVSAAAAEEAVTAPLVAPIVPPSLDAIKAAAEIAPKAVKQAAEPVTKLAEPVAAAAQTATESVAQVVETTAETAEAITEKAADAATGAIDRVAETAAAAVPAPEFTEAQPAAPAATNTVKGYMTMATAAPATAQAMFGDMNERAKGMFEKSTRMNEEMVEFTKGNVEAMVAAARTAAKGSEAMAQDAAEFGKKSFEHATAAFKGMASAKSPTELFQLQSDFAKSSFDAAVAEASKNSEAMLKLMGEVFQPLSNRYAVASEKMKATTSAY